MLATICRRPVTLTFDLEVGVGVACDLGYPCAKFRLPRPFGFRVRADVRDIRRTDGRTTDADHRIMPPRRGHNKLRAGTTANSTVAHTEEHHHSIKTTAADATTLTTAKCQPPDDIFLAFMHSFHFCEVAPPPFTYQC